MDAHADADTPDKTDAIAAWMCSAAVVAVHPARHTMAGSSRAVVADAMQRERAELKLAFEPSDACARALDATHVTPIATVRHRAGDAVALVSRMNEHTLIVSFCKTTSAVDVVHDMNLLYAPWSGGMVHRGFLSKYMYVQKPLLSLLNRLLQSSDRGARILLTGHSLGGAMALLAALHMHENMPDTPIQAIAFGAPRVGDAAIAAKLRALPVHRIAHPLDIVPAMLPPPWYANDVPSWPEGPGDAMRWLTNAALLIATLRHHNGHHRSAQYRPLLMQIPDKT